MKLYDVRILRREMEECRRMEKELPRCQSIESRALAKNLRRRCEELATVLWEIAQFIEKIEDPELRLIFELRYFRGWGWQRIAEELPTQLTADGVRMKHRRYLFDHSGRIDQLVIRP